MAIFSMNIQPRSGLVSRHRETCDRRPDTNRRDGRAEDRTSEEATAPRWEKNRTSTGRKGRTSRFRLLTRLRDRGDCPAASETPTEGLRKPGTGPTRGWLDVIFSCVRETAGPTGSGRGRGRGYRRNAKSRSRRSNYSISSTARARARALAQFHPRQSRASASCLLQILRKTLPMSFKLPVIYFTTCSSVISKLLPQTSISIQMNCTLLNGASQLSFNSRLAIGRGTLKSVVIVAIAVV